MAGNEDFKKTTAPSGEERAQRSFLYELVVRFITLRHYQYKQRLDVHDYLDEGIISVVGNPQFDWEREKEVFNRAFKLINEAKGDTAFAKSGRFSLGYYEFITLGVASACETNESLTADWLAQRDQLDQRFARGAEVHR